MSTSTVPSALRFDSRSNPDNGQRLFQTLPDPGKLLSGKGPKIRSLRLVDGLKPLKSDEVDALIATAVLQRGWKLDTRAKGELIVKSISAKQRPRRP